MDSKTSKKKKSYAHTIQKGLELLKPQFNDFSDRLVSDCCEIILPQLHDLYEKIVKAVDEKCKNHAVYQYKDRLPLHLQPLYLAYSYSFGYLLWAWFYLVYKTSKIEFTFEDKLTDKNYILAIWHEWLHITPLIAFHFIENPHPTLKTARTAHLYHPAWYFGPLYVLTEAWGNKILLGSAGNDGKAAALEVTKDLKKGFNTIVLPDGPYGPPHKIKKGVLHMALQAKCAILPVKAKYKSNWGHIKMFWLWDKKILPLPGGKVQIIFGKPIRVNSKDDFKKTTQFLKSNL